MYFSKALTSWSLGGSRKGASRLVRFMRRWASIRTDACRGRELVATKIIKMDVPPTLFLLWDAESIPFSEQAWEHAHGWRVLLQEQAAEVQAAEVPDSPVVTAQPLLLRAGRSGMPFGRRYLAGRRASIDESSDFARAYRFLMSHLHDFVLLEGFSERSSVRSMIISPASSYRRS